MTSSNPPLINRELSWLEFNQRVLEEAQDESLPLLERLKFLSITGSNLDEFYQIRVAALKDQIAGEVVTPTPDTPTIGIGRRTPINNWTDAVGHGSVIAMDPTTGQRRWTFEQFDVTDSGILTTATDLLFTGGREGYFYALDARTGKPLWSANLGGQIVNGAITYEVDGRQYVAIISGNDLVAFALRQ